MPFGTVPREYADCQGCNGPIKRGGYAVTDGWTHVRREDWIDKVHQAVPREGTIRATVVRDA